MYPVWGMRQHCSKADYRVLRQLDVACLRTRDRLSDCDRASFIGGFSEFPETWTVRRVDGTSGRKAIQREVWPTPSQSRAKAFAAWIPQLRGQTMLCRRAVVQHGFMCSSGWTPRVIGRVHP
jgi:hypothetical protein